MTLQEFTDIINEMIFVENDKTVKIIESENDGKKILKVKTDEDIFILTIEKLVK
jgi:hypothetical protein